MSGIEFHLDAAGEFRWRLKAEGNHEIIGASTEGYHNLTEAAENLVQLTTVVLEEAYNGQDEYKVELEEVERVRLIVLNYVMGLAAKGIPQDEAEHAARKPNEEVDPNQTIPVRAALPSMPWDTSAKPPV